MPDTQFHILTMEGMRRCNVNKLHFRICTQFFIASVCLLKSIFMCKFFRAVLRARSRSITLGLFHLHQCFSKLSCHGSTANDPDFHDIFLLFSNFDLFQQIFFKSFMIIPVNILKKHNQPDNIGKNRHIRCYKIR